MRAGYSAENPCVCKAYEVFWAEFDANGNEHKHTVKNTSPGGTNHAYQMIHTCDGCAQWKLYYDYNLVGTSTYQQSGTILDAQAGLEDSYVNTQTHADTFDNYMQYLDVNHVWRSWPSAYTWVDQPCSTYANYFCLNGSLYSSNHWADNKP